MALWRQIGSGLRGLLRKKRADADLDEELRAYMEMAAADKVRQGKNVQQAARAVRQEQGGLDATKEIVSSARWESLVETIWQDVRFGIRTLSKAKGFTIVA